MTTEQTTDVVVKETPVEAPAVPPSETRIGDDRSLDELLAQYDQATAHQAEPAADNAVQDGQAAQDNELNTFIGQLDAGARDRKRIDELTGEIGNMRAQMHQQEELKAFDKYADELQSRLPEYCTPDHARNALLAAAAQDPNLEAAWRYRNLTHADRRAADLEFRRLEALHAQVLRAPPDPRKASALAEIKQRAYQLGLAMNSPAILLRVTREIERRPRSFGLSIPTPARTAP